MHFSSQNLPAVKHSQYIFKHWDFAHLQKRVATVEVFCLITANSGLMLWDFCKVFFPKPLVLRTPESGFEEACAEFFKIESYFCIYFYSRLFLTKMMKIWNLHVLVNYLILKIICVFDCRWKVWLPVLWRCLAEQVILILDAARLLLSNLFNWAVFALRSSLLIFHVLVQMAESIFHSQNLILVSNHLWRTPIL